MTDSQSTQLLHLELLGSPSIKLGQHQLTGFVTTKAQALFIYLAMTQRVHSRDTLAHLLWENIPAQQGKKNLRNILSNLRTLVGSYLLITRYTVAFNRHSPYRLDVEMFRSALTASPTTSNLRCLYDTLALYRDDFLAGFYVRDVLAFEDWVLMEREHLHSLACDGLLALAKQCLEQGAYQLGLMTTQRLLALEPWSEVGYQYQMLLLAYTGQRSAALAQYAACCKMLADAFDVPPLQETTTLYNQIKSEAFEKPRLRPALLLPGSRADPQVHWAEFPKRTTVYGRHDELAQLHQWLMMDEVSLVGTFGLGGQGKTTLVAELAWRLAKNEFPLPIQAPFERIIWRSLLNAPPFTTALQGWLRFLSGHQVTQVPDQVDEQLAVLFDYLYQQRCLLILDNAERILYDGVSPGQLRPGYEAYAQLIRQVSQRVHQSCLLFISREYLPEFPVQEETAGVQVLHLRGLSEQAGMQLVRTGGLNGSNEAIKALIRQYSGHPLALRLVVATVQEFFAGKLDAFVADVPPIFDDIRQLFDQQFRKLTPIEKGVMIRLAQARQPISLQTLWDQFYPPSSRHAVLEALRTLKHQSLLEIWNEGLSLQNILTEYVNRFWYETQARGGWVHGGAQNSPLSVC